MVPQIILHDFGVGERSERLASAVPGYVAQPLSRGPAQGRQSPETERSRPALRELRPRRAAIPHRLGLYRFDRSPTGLGRTSPVLSGEIAVARGDDRPVPFDQAVEQLAEIDGLMGRWKLPTSRWTIPAVKSRGWSRGRRSTSRPRPAGHATLRRSRPHLALAASNCKARSGRSLVICETGWPSQ